MTLVTATTWSVLPEQRAEQTGADQAARQISWNFGGPQ